MEPDDDSRNSVAHRLETAIAAVLPRSVAVRCHRVVGHTVSLALNGKRITVRWIGEGGLRQARESIADRNSLPEVVVARRMSPGAREALSAVGVGWVDESGAAEIAEGSLIVSRSGRPEPISVQANPLDTRGACCCRSTAVRREGYRQLCAADHRVVRGRRRERAAYPQRPGASWRLGTPWTLLRPVRFPTPTDCWTNTLPPLRRWLRRRLSR